MWVVDVTNDYVDRVSGDRSSNDVKSIRLIICTNILSDLISKLTPYNTSISTGTIDDGLSLASMSRIRGVGLRYSFVDERTELKLTTCNAAAEQSWVPQDQVSVRLENQNQGATIIETTNHQDGTYTISYRVPLPGLYRIHVLVNGTALPDTPVDCHVFPSHDLEFEQEGEHLHPADNSEPCDSVLLQSDHRTVLIANQQTQHSCKIYASPTARPTYLPKLPMQCWRVKLTLACARLVIKLVNVM